jgi:redox-sensitive bicupin YhaK (pirin superfamily)
MANYILHKNNTRGFADHGWLKSYHTFSFANYMDPKRVHFGALRVLNDDKVAGGMGFGTHPHDNMEIVTIPLKGDLEHKDSMGNTEVIRHNDVQIMSAGTGITHSEYNHNSDRDVELLQIWVFPAKRGITPRYDQKTYRPEDRVNKLVEVVAPDNPEAVWINQDARFLLGNFGEGFSQDYKIRSAGNGVYVFLISGSATVDGQLLEARDGLGIQDTGKISIRTEKGADVLLIEVPMEL